MRTSNHIFIALGLLAQTAISHADVATFANTEAKLSGTLQTADKNGIIEWQSPHAKQPLKLRAEKIQKLEFSTSPEARGTAPIQISLRNGDLIPANRVTALEEAGLMTETSIAGLLTIPRAALSSAQFGVTDQNVVYAGFDNISEWTTGMGQPDNWKRRGNALVSSGPSIAARDCKLPENFVISFGLTWDTRSPSYSIGFADDLVKDPRKQNRYLFNFDGSGIRILRQAPGETRARTLSQWPRRPSDFPNNNFKVELKVNRSKQQMELFIDGESEGLIVDQLDTLPSPTGGGISFNCQSHSGSQTISALTITELNDARTRHLAEKRGDPSLDCLITTEDDRWSGQLLSLAGNAEQTLMTFKTSFAEEAWEIPESAISTIFFANNPFKEGPGGETAYIIEFHEKGRLSAKSFTIIGDQVEAVHPLLGNLQIERSAIKLIRRIE